MDRRSTVLALVAAGFLALVGVGVVQSQPARESRQAWQYMEVQLPSNVDSTPTLNQMGAEGWQLVSVVSACGTLEKCNYYAFFMRPR